jgi:alpha-L-fucosidase 2
MLIKNSIRASFILLMALTSCSTSYRESNIKSAKLDGDVKLLYLKPADNWTKGFPIGNGTLGAMVLGGLDQERIAFNHCRLWRENKLKGLENPKVANNLPLIRKTFFDGKIKEANDLANELMGAQKFTGPDPFQPAGDMLIDFPGNEEVSEYRRELDLSTGIVKIRYNHKGINYLREVFASATDGLIVVHLSADKPKALNCRLNLSRTNDPDCKITSWISGNCIGYTGEFVEKVRFAASAKVLTEGGRLTIDSIANPKIDVTNADEIMILLSVSTEKETDNSKNYCLQQLGKFNSIGVFEGMSQSHVAEHQRLFNRMDLSFSGTSKQNIPTDQRILQFKNGDPDLGLVSLFFQYGRYLLMSSSKPGGLPANLQGIWNEKLLPPWQSDYHHDINIQMNYWPTEVCNLSECADPYLDYVESMLPSARIAAQNLYNCRGIYIPLTSDPAVKCLKTETKWSEWTGAAAWLAHHFWLRWEYTRDQDFLSKKVYPLYKEVALFYQDYLVTDSRKASPFFGKLVTVPSYSPENAYAGGPQPVSLVIGATMDFELIYEVFTNLIEASKILGIDQEKRKEWQNILDNIPPLQIGKYGQLQEWLEDYEESKNAGHSSVSQQYALFSSSQITPERTPELARAARTSLERRVSLNKPGAGGGWPGAVFSFCWARLNQGDRAYDLLRNMIGNSANGVLFGCGSTSHQIDQNFGITADIAEMLLQSHNGEIKILPALPAAWPSGHIRGLKARGGFEVEIYWENNRMKNAKILSILGNKCIIRSSITLLVRSDDKIINTLKVSDSVTEFETNAGATYGLEYASGI